MNSMRKDDSDCELSAIWWFYFLIIMDIKFMPKDDSDLQNYEFWMYDNGVSAKRFSAKWSLCYPLLSKIILWHKSSAIKGRPPL